MLFDLDVIKQVYEGFKKNYDGLKQRENRPLTLTEKNLIAPRESKYTKVTNRGDAYVDFHLIVAMQDATAQMAIYNSCKPEKEGRRCHQHSLRSFNPSKSWCGGRFANRH